MTIFLAILLGLVEGLTEFLPISSTGHLILVSHLFGFEGEKAKVFDIFIQIGAVLAVVLEFRGRLLTVARDLTSRPASRRFVGAVGIAFVPAAALGFLYHRAIEDRLFGPATVAAALIVGAVLIFVVEAMQRAAGTHEAEAIGFGPTPAVGLSQCHAL